MKFITVKVFEFAELSPEAKKRALDWYRSSVVLDSELDDMKADAKDVSFIIDSLSEEAYEGEFEADAETTAREILEQHGSATGTHQVAKAFFERWQDAQERLRNIEELIKDIDRSETKHWLVKREQRKLAGANWSKVKNEIMTLEQEFESALAAEYASLWSKQIDFLTSDEGMIEVIDANAYEFLEDGSRCVIKPFYKIKNDTRRKNR